MQKLTTLIENGEWYKGNTHAHTNVSDAMISPKELKDIYMNDGYSFLAITDHCVYGIYEEFNTEKFIILPGVELHINVGPEISGDKTFFHHIVGLGMPGLNTFKHGEIIEYDKFNTSLSELISLLNNAGNICIYAHPKFSHTRIEELEEIEGCLGMEIYNHASEVNCLAGYSELYYSRLLWNSHKYLCIASDDTHQHQKDYLGGFINVKAKSLTQENIFDAIKNGSFYSSNGPHIEKFYVDQGKAVVKCSGCSKIAFEADNIAGYCINAEDKPLFSGEYKLSGNENFIKVICVDNLGKKAWSQPIWLN